MKDSKHFLNLFTRLCSQTMAAHAGNKMNAAQRDIIADEIMEHIGKLLVASGRLVDKDHISVLLEFGTPGLQLKPGNLYTTILLAGLEWPPVPSELWGSSWTGSAAMYYRDGTVVPHPSHKVLIIIGEEGPDA